MPRSRGRLASIDVVGLEARVFRATFIFLFSDEALRTRSFFFYRFAPVAFVMHLITPRSTRSFDTQLFFKSGDVARINSSCTSRLLRSRHATHGSPRFSSNVAPCSSRFLADRQLSRRLECPWRTNRFARERVTRREETSGGKKHIQTWSMSNDIYSCRFVV